MEHSYLKELEAIRQNFVLMANMVIENVNHAIKALAERDFDLADDVVARDKRIDQIENEIDSESIRYLTLRQPVASDMRALTVAIRGTHDLERIGDEAKAIAKRIPTISEKTRQSIGLRCIPEMATTAVEMLSDAVKAMQEHEISLALGVIRRDRHVDTLNRTNFEEFGELITRSPDQAQSILALILISKSVERIADHATNIAEEAIFLISGKEVRHSGLKKQLNSEADDLDG